MNSFNLIALIIFTLTALTSVNGLRCYKCNSLSKPYCSDPYDPPDTGEVALEYQADCDKEIDKIVRNETHQGLAPHVDRNGSQYIAVCRKVVQKVENVVRVFRSCGWFDAASEEPICSQRTGSLGVTHTHCVCRVTVDGLECWMCKGNINSGCTSPFMPELFAKKKCADNEKVCLKITQNVNGETFNIRRCGVLDANTPNRPESMGCKDVSDKGLPTVQECICNSDGCNGSSQLIAYSVTSIVPIIIFALLVA